jgi:hypothetical protein
MFSPYAMSPQPTLSITLPWFATANLFTQTNKTDIQTSLWT